MISTFPSRHYSIDDYPSLKNYLLTFDKRILAQSGEKNIDGIKGKNARKKTCNKWFETQDSISYWDDFNKHKLVYKEISQELSFSLANEKMMILNTAYMITSEDNLELQWLMMFLNSKLINWYYHTMAVQLGTATRLMYMYVIRIPIIRIDGNEKLFEQLKICFDNGNQNQFDDIICKEYGLTTKETEYIMASKD